MTRRDNLLCQQHQDNGRYYSLRQFHLFDPMILLLALQKMVDCDSPAVLIEVDSVRGRICANRARIILHLCRTPRPVLSHPKFALPELPILCESYRRASRSRCEGN